MIDRYFTGVALSIVAAALIHVGQPVWAILPGAAGVYILISVLIDTVLNRE
jgi:hypothetical protein